MRKKLFKLSALPVALAALSGVMTARGYAEERQVSSLELREQTREDVIAGYHILLEHYPGVYNPFDPSFASRLQEAKDVALSEAERVLTAEDRVLAIENINRMLSDGHSRIQIGYNGSLGEWPRFSAEWRGDGLYVTSSLDSAPLRGAKLLSCDGQAASELIEAEVFRVFGRPAEAGQWWQLGGSFFRRGMLSVQPAPTNCLFADPDGTSESVALRWEPFPMAEFERLIAAAQPQPVGMTRLAGGLRWITLSSFSPDADDRTAYNEIFDALDAHPPASSERAIVLDLRGNKGGSSTWPQKIAEHIWGKQAVDWALADYFRQTEVWYFADQENINHFRSVAKQMRELGQTEIASWSDDLSQRLQTSLDGGLRFYREAYGKQLLSAAGPTNPRVTPPVYVIIDGGCASACLDALDIFKRFKGVKLVGAPSSADTEYLEIRREPLPSGRGSVILPTKIWINRPRKSGQVYQPDLLVTDLDWTTAVMVKHISDDLNVSLGSLHRRDRQRR